VHGLFPSREDKWRQKQQQDHENDNMHDVVLTFPRCEELWRQHQKED